MIAAVHIIQNWSTDSIFIPIWADIVKFAAVKVAKTADDVAANTN